MYLLLPAVTPYQGMKAISSHHKQTDLFHLVCASATGVSNLNSHQLNLKPENSISK